MHKLLKPRSRQPAASGGAKQKRAFAKQLLINGIAINIRQNPRARRIIIKIRHGEVELVIPRRGSLKRALKFYESKEIWVHNKLAQQPEKIALKIGATLNVLDQPRKVNYDSMCGKSKITDDFIIINGDPALANQKIKKVISEYLKTELSVIVAEKAKEISRKYQKIIIRDNVTRWGSCSSRGTLSFCWRIAFAPRFVMEYLAAHEVAHLREMNHGKRFWHLVAQIYPNYAVAEQWLKKNGNRLHLYN